MPSAPERNAARSRDSVRAGAAQFAHTAPDSPGLPGGAASVLREVTGDSPCGPSALGRLSEQGPPHLHPLREQSSVMLNFVFQELPLWGGLHSQPCLDSYHCVCKEASNKRFS